MSEKRTSIARAPKVLLWKIGLSADRGPRGQGDDAVLVRHNDVGINYLESGRMRVLLSTGYRYVLGPGHLAVFWGGIPHKVEAYNPGSMLHWLALPLGTFLNWPMPSLFTRQLIAGRVFIETDKREAMSDRISLDRWREHLASGDPEAREIVLLELEARLRRLARSCPTPRRITRLGQRGRGEPADRMLVFVSEHFREELTAADVAAAVGLHPDYGRRLFCQRVGMGLNDYIIECRLSHAKAMLATTDAKVLDVALDSGFGSVSQFHAVFKRLVGATPRRYRITQHMPDDPPRT